MDLLAGDLHFTGHGQLLSLHSDPGTRKYRTLEVDWLEQDVYQRLSIYFAADKHDWWVSGMRTYDGRENADWIYFDGDLPGKTPRGETWTGDLELTGVGGAVPGSLTIRDLRLTAFAPDPSPAATVH